MRKIAAFFNNEFARLLTITVGIFVLMTALRPSTFLTSRNLISMSFQMPEMGMLSLAITLAFITGGMDLSLVGISNLSGICAGLVMSSMLANAANETQVVLLIALAVIVAAVVGVICGAFNGMLISALRVTPILATLGTMQLYTGIALIITKGSAVVGLPDQFSVIGQGSLGFFPIPMLIFLVSAVLVQFMLNKTKTGIESRLIGTNEKAARYSGISVAKTKLISYMTGGLLAAVGGLIMMSRVNSAKADFGSSYTMQTILIAVLGGVSPSGGKGKVVGVVLAVCTLQFLSSGFNMLRMSQYAKELVWGILLILLVAMLVFGERKEST